MKYKLKNGFELEIDNSSLDNWELLEVLADIDAGKSTMITKAFPMLIGDNQFAKLKEHMRKNGKISIAEMVETFTEIMNQLENGKK